MKSPFLNISACMLAVLWLEGCAVNHEKAQFAGLGLTYQSAIQEQADGTFFVEVEAAPAAGRVTGARGMVTNLAIDHCKKMDKSMSTVSLTEDSNLLVNGVARLKFKCE